MQEHYVTKRVYNNVLELEEIQADLQQQIMLAKNSTQYLKIYAHRVGLLSKNEYYIHLETPLFTKDTVYSPGTVVMYNESYYMPNNLLFFISFAIECLTLSFLLLRKRSRENSSPVQRRKKTSKKNSEQNDPDPEPASLTYHDYEQNPGKNLAALMKD